MSDVHHAVMAEPTILAALHMHAASRPEAEALAWCGEEGAVVERWNCARLWREASTVAARIAAAGVQPGERVLLLAPQGLAYVAGFYGALIARVIPVTLPAPRSRRSVERVRLVAEDCAPVAMLVTAAQQAGLARAFATVAALTALRQVLLDGAQSSPELQLVEPPDPLRAPGRAEARDDIAFLQYTSGSTSEPKGVMITHANLAHQCAAIGALSAMDAASAVVSWLPLTHDMGLIGAVLAPLFHGGRTVLMPPSAVLQKPLLWLETAARERATMLVGPDFGYAACAQAAARETPRRALDLATLTTVWTGAEPVRAETIERFNAAFAGVGFRPEMWLPCYGMAETTLLACGHAAGRAPTVRSFCATALATGEAIHAEGSHPHRALTSCGVAPRGMEVIVVAPDTRTVLPADRVGAISTRRTSRAP